MATNFSIDKLTGSENYPIWYAAIYDHFKTKKLTKYVTSNYLATLKISESSTANERKFYDDCIAEDAQVCSDITANVVDRIKFFIKDSPNAYAKMQKLKTLYYIDNSALCGMWIKQLYTIRANSFHETMEVINEICELFRLLKTSSMDLPKMEKISIMYDALPKELQDKVTFSSSMEVGTFYTEIKDKYTMLSYRRERKSNYISRINIQKSKDNLGQTSNNVYEDKMDIDNIESHSINYISNVRNYDKQTKFCLICGNQGHFAKDCYFNPCGTNKNNSRVKIINNKNNNYNKGSCNNNNNKRRNKNNNRKRRNNNTINNIECLDEREFTPCYEEINIMHGKFIDSIEYNNIMILNIMNKQIT